MKKLMIALAVGAFVLSMAGVSSATDVNIFGASAQFNFWSAQAPIYLTSTSGTGPHCSSGFSQTTFVPKDNQTATPMVYYHGAKYYIASASGCNTSVVPDGSLTIRVGAYDSVDGIQALLNVTNVTDVAGCTGDERAMLHTTTSTGINASDCFPVTLAASDVDATSIVESDFNTQLDGPSGPPAGTFGYTLPGKGVGGTEINYDLGSWSAPGENYAAGWDPTTVNMSTINNYHPFVLPFGIFANVAANSSDTTKQLQASLTNLTTAMVQEIFAGKQTVSDWSEFGVAPGTCTGSNCPITICLRQPGSGTYAIFDNGVFDTVGIGPSLLVNDKIAGTNAWFNNTSGDMTNCVNSIPGAIGFMDADTGTTGTNFYLLNLNGFSPIAVSGSTSNPNVVDGLYERFFSLEHVFELNTNTGNSHTVIQNMLAYPNGWSYTQSNNPRQNVWVISTTMKWHKSADNVYPYVAGPYPVGD